MKIEINKSKPNKRIYIIIKEQINLGPVMKIREIINLGPTVKYKEK
jgi:hypothetical protein